MGWLVSSCRVGQRVFLHLPDGQGTIEVRVVERSGDGKRVRLAILAPVSVRIEREHQQRRLKPA